MLSATAAPTPTLLASSASLSALARSSSLLCALIVTLALLAVTCAPALNDGLGVVVQDDVDRDRAGDADVGLAGAGARLGDDLVLREAEERAVRCGEPSVHGSSVP